MTSRALLFRLAPPLEEMGMPQWMTRSRPSMCSPRAATSVATKTSRFPFRKLSMILFRWNCGRSPWSALHVPPVQFSERSPASSTVSIFVLVNMMARRGECTRSKSTRREARALGVTGIESICNCFGASSAETSNMSGLWHRRFPTSRSWFESVAQNNRHCTRSPRGIASTIMSNSSAKPASSIWSASSNTRNCVLSRERWRDLTRSTMRPRVPIAT
mmetsp:Transcript_25260/g.60165  ORF Transcript_25260/g.60165 Transcript_25260/m.60165 type:complete len:217 (+) Transcript_25260:106-756(+)